MLHYLSAKQWSVVAALFAALWLAVIPHTLVLESASHAAAVVLITLVLWSTGLFPPFLTALIFFAMVIIFKLAAPALIFSGFASTAVWLIISGFVIGAAITRSGLGQRLAGWLEPYLAGSYGRLIGGLALVAMLLGFIMPSSTGRAVVLVPIGMALAERVGFAKGSKGRLGIAVTLALTCNMPSFAILPANIPNMILSGASETLHHLTFGYTDYLLLHFPVLGVLKSLLIVTLVRVMFPATITANEQPDDANERPTQPLSAMQWKVALMLLATLLMWMTDSIHGINPAWVGVITAILLLLPGFGVLPAKEFNGSVDFGMVLFVSAALGLGALVNASGLGTAIGLQLQQWLPLASGHSFTNFFSLSAMAALTGLVATIPGVPTVLTPMAPDLSAATGMSLPAVLMTQVIGFSTVIFPYQVGPLIVAMQLSGERLGYLLKITLPLALITFVLLVPLDYLWWCLLGWLN